MTDLLDTLLPLLEAHRLPGGADYGNDIIYPFYPEFSLSNLPASICYWLGAPPLGAPPLGRELMEPIGGPYQHVVLLLVDGLGLDLFLRLSQPGSGKSGNKPIWQRMLPQGLLGSITSIAPSTTSAALTTLWTGQTPAEHGIMGYEVWLKEYGMIANMIFQTAAAFHGDTGGLRRAGFSPETFLPSKTLGTHLLENGVLPYAFQPSGIARSGLSVMHMKDVNIFPYRSRSDLWISLANTLASNRSERTYSYVYWGDIDDLSHRYGPGDERVRLELASFSLMLERFLASLKTRQNGRTLFIMTADHGHIHTEPNPNLELRNHPEFLSYLAMLPTGESRLSYLTLHPGREDDMRAYVEKHWPGQFRLAPTKEVLELTLLGTGKIYPPVYDRTGDWIAVPQGNNYWWFSDRDNPLIGRHGGLSRDEMLVPLFAMEV